jgi:hypothetical protein
LPLAGGLPDRAARRPAAERPTADGSSPSGVCGSLEIDLRIN